MPVHITSRIDLPRPNSRVPAGQVPIAGIAWAPLLGVGQVQVQVDAEPWRDARLGPFVAGTTWRQYSYDWLATAGRHQLRVQAFDTLGNAQNSAPAPVFPSGATGLHTVTVTVT